MAAPIDLTGKWTCVRTENIEALLEAMGMNIVMRKIASKVKPVHTIEQDGNKFTLVITGTPKRETVTFTVGEEFKHTVPVFKGELTGLATWVGDKLVVNSTPTDENQKQLKTTREIIGDEYVQTLEVNGVEGKTIFKKG